jgi:tetratricopeptide (TPR) repeat protein
MTMRPLLLTVVAIVGFTGPALAQRSENWTRCVTQDRNYSPDLAIAACSSLIDSGKEKWSNLVIAFYDRGNAYKDKGLYDRAIADYDMAIEIDPKYADAYNNRAWVYFKTGKFALGLPDAEKAVELGPNHAYTFAIRGCIFEALGKKDDAIADYRRALAKDPNMESSKEGLKRLGGST